jgi:hypothetical protein
MFGLFKKKYKEYIIKIDKNGSIEFPNTDFKNSERSLVMTLLFDYGITQYYNSNVDSFFNDELYKLITPEYNIPENKIYIRLHNNNDFRELLSDKTIDKMTFVKVITTMLTLEPRKSGHSKEVYKDFLTKCYYDETVERGI